MSGFFRNSSSMKPNVLTFLPPDLGMLRRSRRVLIFPKSRCIIYFDLRVPDYSNMVLEKGKIKLNLCTAAALAAACDESRKVASPRSTKRLRTPTQLVHTYPIKGLFFFFNSADCGNIMFNIN